MPAKMLQNFLASSTHDKSTDSDDETSVCTMEKNAMRASSMAKSNARNSKRNHNHDKSFDHSTSRKAKGRSSNNGSDQLSVATGTSHHAPTREVQRRSSSSRSLVATGTSHHAPTREIKRHSSSSQLSVATTGSHHAPRREMQRHSLSSQLSVATGSHHEPRRGRRRRSSIYDMERRLRSASQGTSSRSMPMSDRVQRGGSARSLLRNASDEEMVKKGGVGGSPQRKKNGLQNEIADKEMELAKKDAMILALVSSHHRRHSSRHSCHGRLGGGELEPVVPPLPLRRRSSGKSSVQEDDEISVDSIGDSSVCSFAIEDYENLEEDNEDPNNKSTTSKGVSDVAEETRQGWDDVANVSPKYSRENLGLPCPPVQSPSRLDTVERAKRAALRYKACRELMNEHKLLKKEEKPLDAEEISKGSRKSDPPLMRRSATEEVPKGSRNNGPPLRRSSTEEVPKCRRKSGGGQLRHSASGLDSKAEKRRAMSALCLDSHPSLPGINAAA